MDALRLLSHEKARIHKPRLPKLPPQALNIDVGAWSPRRPRPRGWYNS
jgi:hypothetical protein